MGLLSGLFGKKGGGGGGGMPPEERAAIEQYLSQADPLLRQLDSEYGQWLERIGISRCSDLTAINDPNGAHSGVFVWRTIEAERTFTQLHPPKRVMRMYDFYVSCLEGRHHAASTIHQALQVADVRSPKEALDSAGQGLGQAEKLQNQAESARTELEHQLG